MRRAVIFYNPHSGQRRGDLGTLVESVAVVLRSAGVETAIEATLSAAESGHQARAAVARGCDTVFACGGDGTIQDIAQGLIGSDAALAIIPFGTANVLAHDLGIPSGPLAAAQAALQAIPLRINVGRVDSRSSEGTLVTRYFLSVAGAGQDGYLFHELPAHEKRALGIVAYFWKALRIWLAHSAEWFSAEGFLANQTAQPERITQLLAVRLHDFGNLLRDLAPGASLLRDDFRLVLFKTSSRWSYLLYILRGLLGATWTIPGVALGSATQARLTPRSGNPVYIEADGELLGQLPAEISIIPSALTLLVPPDFASRQPRWNLL